MARLSVTQTRAGTGEKSQAAKSWNLSCVSAKSYAKLYRFEAIFRAKQKPKREIAGRLNWQASIPWVWCVYTVDFQADDYFKLW